MSEENVETVGRLIDAWNRDDLDGFLACFVPEAEWHTTGVFVDEGVYRGRAGLERLWAEIREDLEEQRASASDIRAVGEEAVVLPVVLTGRGKRSKAPFEEQPWFVATFRDGLVARMETYRDAAPALEAVGLRE